MSEHPILNAIRRQCFMPLGWFAPKALDQVPDLDNGMPARFVILIGNAGPLMFDRFQRERNAGPSSLDQWCRKTIEGLAAELDAKAVFPFDVPALPFVSWALCSGAMHRSPLGLTIHADFGLWHAYRAALIFSAAFDIPPVKSQSPCETCEGRPCLKACPVKAFDGKSYNVEACVDHISTRQGSDCMEGGCLARRACPVGWPFTYKPVQMKFHMTAFHNSRLAARAETS